MPWKQRECQEQAHRPKHQRGLWVQRSDLQKRRMVTSTQTEELAIHPSELHAPRREEDVQAVCWRLQVRARDAKWAVCHAAVIRRLLGPASTRKEPASKRRARPKDQYKPRESH